MTKPAPGPDQPPIPVRLVTFNTHHGVGGDDAGTTCPGWPRCWPRWTPTSSACRRSTGTSATAARTSTRRCCSPGRWTCSWPGGRRSTSPRPGGEPRGQYGNALLSRLPILISDVHRLPGGGRAAQRAAHDARARRRHAVGDRHAPDHRSGARARRAGGRPGRAAHRADGGRRPRRRLQRPPRTPRSWPRCASGSPTPGSWRTSGDDQAGWRFWQRDEGRHPPRALPAPADRPGLGLPGRHRRRGAGAGRRGRLGPPAAHGRPGGPRAAV